jgi:hypothetical protein
MTTTGDRLRHPLRIDPFPAPYCPHMEGAVRIPPAKRCPSYGTSTLSVGANFGDGSILRSRLPTSKTAKLVVQTRLFKYSMECPFTDSISRHHFAAIPPDCLRMGRSRPIWYRFVLNPSPFDGDLATFCAADHGCDVTLLVVPPVQRPASMTISLLGT